MPRVQVGDAFGRALLDRLEGDGEPVEIIERDDGFIAMSTRASAYFGEPGGDGSLDQAALDEVRGHVVDVGCGAGRFALKLQEAGHGVVAIDRSPLAVEVCRRRGVRDVRILTVARISRALGMFDTVLMMGNNFGLFGGRDSMRRILERMDRATNPAGRIVAEGIDPYRTDDPAHLDYHRSNRERGRMGGQIRMRVRYRTLATPWFDYLFVSIDELEELLRGTVWRLAKTIHDTGPGPGWIVVLEKR
jgi:SAM-dependent methyltransferase